MRNVFERFDPWPGASCGVRHSLSQAILDDRPTLKLLSIIKKLRLTYVSPYWKEDAWAHFGLTEERVAIVQVEATDNKRADKFRRGWAVYGWELIVVKKSNVMAATEDQLVHELARHLVDIRQYRKSAQSKKRG
jgi:hypothetical protein